MPTNRTSDGELGANRRSRPVQRSAARRLLASPLWWSPVLALLITVIVVPSAAPVAAARQPAPPSPAIGELYKADCGVCHGGDGQGTSRGPTLVGVGRASLDYEMSSGRMPLAGVGRADDRPGAPLQPLPNKAASDPEMVPRRHAPAYPPETIKQLVDYTSALTGGGGPDIPHVGHGNLAEGGALFRLHCAGCHAWAGDGGALVEFQSGQMPAFGDAALTEEQVAGVVAYVKYLRDPEDKGGEPLWHLGPFAEGAVSLVALAALLAFVRWIGERG
jgi:ubiquinol-cytochrome c reductase cytochrome c subunit